MDCLKIWSRDGVIRLTGSKCRCICIFYYYINREAHLRSHEYTHLRILLYLHTLHTPPLPMHIYLHVLHTHIHIPQFIFSFVI